MTQVIIKQLGVFPKVTKNQLYRLVKSYRGYTSQDKFIIELKHLVRVGIAKVIITDTSFEYALTKRCIC